VVDELTTHPTPTIDVLLVEDLGQQRLSARGLVAALRAAGLSAQLAHFGLGDDPAHLVALARRVQPRLIVLSLLFAHLVAENLDLASHLRAAGLTAHLTMVGPLPAFAYAELLAGCPALDSVLRAPFTEAGLVSLAAGLRDGADWQGTCGLAYRSPALRANPLPHPTYSLDELPFPARDGGIPARLGFGFATLEASRGCYHTCAFCLPCAFYRAVQAPSYQLRSIPALVAEMETLYGQGTRLFLFDDEQFLPPPERRAGRIQALADELERRGLKIAFTIKCRADDVDPALFRQLKALGLVRVYVGIESGCQATLDLLGKGVSARRNAQSLAELDELGILADFRCLLFHPWSTLETVRADLAFLEQVLPHVATPFTFHEVECYPGTALAERLLGAARNKGGPSPPRDRDFRLAYTIADPGAELLRRLSRVVFGARDKQGGLHHQISQAWYDLVVQQRFRPQQLAADQGRALRESVARLNRESLAVWKEMLASVGGGENSDVARVNACAATWAVRINTFDMRVAEELDAYRGNAEYETKCTQTHR
jgi:hypothetical protein